MISLLKLNTNDLLNHFLNHKLNKITDEYF